MKRLAFVIAAVALAAPLAALAADPGTPPGPACRTEQHAMGADAFKALYGTNADKSNAFGKCVAKKAAQRAHAAATAAAQCRAEQVDATFAGNHGGETFDQFYGTGKHGKNAFGKCVSSKAQAANGAADAIVLDAVLQCRAERANDPAAFRARYGKNRTRANAFGKCVALRAKAKTP
jgi:hypothetical protein